MPQRGEGALEENVNTFSTEDRTRTYQNLERTQSRFESGDAQFERELPPEILAELFRSRPRSPRMAGNRSHTAAGRVWGPPPPDVRSSDTPRWWKWWAAAIAGILLFAGVWAAINQLPRQVYFSPPIDSVPPSPSPVLEVRRALPVVEVRRALPTVLRALPVNSALVPVPTTGWQSIQMPNGAKIAVHYEGELPSSAALP